MNEDIRQAGKLKAERLRQRGLRRGKKRKKNTIERMDEMGKYVAKRIGYMALVFLIVSFLMYSLYNLIPTVPARDELEAQKQSLKPAEY